MEIEDIVKQVFNTRFKQTKAADYDKWTEFYYYLRSYEETLKRVPDWTSITHSRVVVEPTKYDLVPVDFDLIPI